MAMQGNLVKAQTPALQLLTESQIEEIHLATLELLRRTGVEVENDDVRERMAQAGCWVEEHRVRIPADLIEWAIRAAPSRVTLCRRDGSPALQLEGRKGYYGTGSDTPFVLDVNSGERRPAMLQDVKNVARLVDGLDNIEFLMCMGIASDVAEMQSDLYHFKAMVENTSKPLVYTAWDRQNLEDIVAMAEAVAGSPQALQHSPFCALYTEPISPLTHAEESCQKLLYMAEKKLPVVYTPGMQIGGTAPVTVAGALVQANAEQLSGLLICQLVQQGAPVICGGGVLFMDMAQGLISYAAPEFMQAMAGLSDLCHYYRLPIFSFAGCSDAKIFDQQASAEGALWMLVSALSGGNLIHDVGYLEGGLTASYQMIAAMDEVAGLVKRFMAGIEVSAETLALPVIDQVGPGGHFIAEDHTYRHFRQNWVPDLFNRETFGDWQAAGAASLGERANDKVVGILKNHEPIELEAGVAAELSNLLQAATERSK
jgi:trimethylamine--corrinoid protein Co-methyltransferase